MTKKSPILAVNEPVKKTTRKRSAPRKTAGSKKTASGKNIGQDFQGEEDHPSVADAFVVLLSAARFHWSLFCHLFLLFLYSSVRLPLETLLWYESIWGMSAIRI